MKEIHPQSPEERRKALARIRARFGKAAIERAKSEIRPLVIAKRVGLGIYDDGFIHAGNLAYLSLLALFPFLILAAAVARLFGRSGDTVLAVNTILGRLPPEVHSVLAEPITEVLDGRSGALLWFGAVVGLWTAASFIETIRDILRRAYGVEYAASFWQYRLAAMAIILGSVVLLFIAFGVSVLLSSVHHFLIDLLPFSEGVGRTLGLYRIVPAVTLFATFYIIFLALTPSRYRVIECRKWPGAFVVTTWWLATVELLPNVLSLFGGYERTYGSLAGVMVALIFFFVIGLGVVAGAELNAALAEPGGKALRGEVYEGPYRDELPVDEPAPEEKQGQAQQAPNKGE
ncbi:YihY/virulence factor BrkB family protein [Sphingomonas xanthus]|uniref:YihY/virulence factor BrkB family protein n=1 Tax=Sphingomonas xanthus TaxID=2594473 RepID=A0A516ISN1_9SPHN|nr:YihY/virulence factor BrkB family protein [Sphingomonas xanthus]QDP19834.1 YihY/virulence factor BrkB family protein [Sphingomonas xanthus]